MRPPPPSPNLSDPSPADEQQNSALEAFLRALADDDPERLYDRAPCGYLTSTADGLIAKVNQTLLTLTGFEQSDLVGRRRFVDLLTPGGRIYHETHYAPMLKMHGSAREIALDLVCADGRRLPVLVNSVLEEGVSGVPTLIRTAVFDASHRREYERELLRAKQRAEESEARAKALARTLQQSLIPPAHPQIPGLELAAAYCPAGDGAEIGGDFYDVFEVSPNDWCVVIGDVCGKGVEAAVVTALARHTVRAAAVRQPQPSGALGTLNEVLLHHHTDRFCTLAVLRLRHQAGGWTATVSCGGHPLPLLIRQALPPVTFGRMGSLVGVLDAPSFSDTTIELRLGDLIVMYTDGLTEARSKGGELYGSGRLVTSLTAHVGSVSGLAEGLLDEAMQFQSGVARDDIALVAIGVPSDPYVEWPLHEV
jgi:sigma-B regulation protein RsbU (phosphoserine phosphatase)